MYFVHKWINKLFLEENKDSENWKHERWQGPPHINTVKDYKLCCPLRSVLSFSLLSYENKEMFLFRQK